MAIQSASEFEAIVTRVRMRAEKALSERGSIPILESAIRDLERIFAAAKQPGKLKPLRKTLDEVTEVFTAQIPDDNALLEQLWDLADYIDYRA